MSMAGDAQVFTARWVFTGTSPPMESGTVTISGSRILAVEPRGTRTADHDLGNTAIIPGLVNTHTHLDLSDMHGQSPPGPDFVAWLRSIVAYRRSQPSGSDQIARGVRDSLRFGTTLVGDISSLGASWQHLSEAPLWAVCFREILGLPGQRVEQVWTELVRWMEQHPDSPTCRAAVSPHAPYSVHRSLIEAAARLWPVCVHLAESPAELELLERQEGSFVPYLKDLGVWDPAGLSPSVEWVAWKTSRAPVALLAHGNYLGDVGPLGPNTTVVYCPRTHAAFGHEAHPFRTLQARGIRVALGTDSLASNPDLDVLAEARFLHARHPDVPGEELLRMATLHGAEALGFAAETGSLEPGKSADLVAVPLPNREDADPHALLLGEEAESGPRRTMWRGRWRTAIES